MSNKESIKEINNIMEDNKRIWWNNLAINNIFLRYPKFNIKIFNDDKQGKVMFDTFVKDKKSNLMVLVSHSYIYQQPIEWDDLEKLKDSFLNLCRLHRDEYIFNKDTAIKEPYDINDL
jgi:hypothetical protein